LSGYEKDQGEDGSIIARHILWKWSLDMLSEWNWFRVTANGRFKYLGLHLDRRLIWHKHIFTKSKQLGLTLTKIHWLLGRKSHLSTTNKLLLYKIILKPIWTYGIQLWGTASTSNIAILETFQSKVLLIIVNSPWYVPNSLIRRDLSCPTVKEEIRR
jgi:hypothetical protein